jgi:hypothetical protein
MTFRQAAVYGALTQILHSGEVEAGNLEAVMQMADLGGFCRS